MGHMRSGRIAVLIVAGLVGSASAVRGEDTLGEIVASIDGDEREWRTLGPDGSGAEYNTSLQAFGPMQTVSIMGFPPGPPATRGVVQVTFTIMAGTLDTVEQQVIYAPDGMRRMWVSPEGEDPITLDEFEASGAGADVSGRMSGRVCLQESLFAGPDPENCKAIEGRFRSHLPPG